MFICGMVLRCAGTIKARLESGPVTADLTTTVVHRCNLLMNDVKTRSLTHSCGISFCTLTIIKNKYSRTVYIK